ncbi:MAG: beta-L-arabinofuranosidase domain-containing protein [Verrucomicrobiota bacterium]
MRSVLSLSLSFFVLTASSAFSAPAVEKGALVLKPVPEGRFQFGGVAGDRMRANVEGWLLAAPVTNPGMLEMFRLRDRQPSPQLVPWAGEFAGKYLLSCAAELRVTDREDLRKMVAAFVAELIGTQAADGYLGPFPEDRRLLGEWDLWGHYHIMRGLLEWHDLTSGKAPIPSTVSIPSSQAMTAVLKAADLICRTYPEGGRRVLEAGSPEMNMAVSHVMAELHRRTGEERYLELTRRIEKDWESTGDYLRTGEAGVPFYKTPRPRWESLHDLQALVELWRITGETRYRDAFISHWRTIRDHDIRNTGAFSGGEQATGNPWAPTAIETCCTVAWMAMSVDMLKLTGGAEVAEELERATFNGALGAQHPRGRWWTYNTPMDGDRKSSAHDIVFQARAGTPELNCCSVNGPRTPGMLADWAVMRDGPALVINTHAPMTFTTTISGGTDAGGNSGGTVRMTCESRYPMDGRIVWHGVSAEKQAVRFRIPPWAEGATGTLNGAPLMVKPGSFCEVERVWTESDVVRFDFPMPLRSVAGQREQEGKISVYRGPLLLAWDQHDNARDEFRLPRLTPELLAAARPVDAPPAGLGQCAPWVLTEIPAPGRPVRLRDFATAGMNGTRYRSWLSGPSAGPVRTGEPPSVTAVKEEVTVNGRDQMIPLALPEGWAAGDFTLSVRVNARGFPDKRAGQVFSAWCASGDDPLRLIIENGRLHARIEGGGGAGTSGIVLTKNITHRVTVVKEGALLTLFLDGEAAVSAAAPATLKSASRLGALGGNPLYTGAPENLPAAFSGFALWPRALSDEEIEALNR